MSGQFVDMNLLVDVLGDAVIAIDVGHCIQFFNAGAESMFGYTRDQVLGKPLDKLIPSRFHVTHAAQVSRFAHSESTSRLMGQRQNIMALRHDGTEFVAEASISKVSGAGGGDIMIVMMRDVSDRLRTQEILGRQAEELAVTRERNRLARDLHDAVSQTLFSASLIADVLPRLWERNPDEGKRRLAELKTLNRGALAEMRMLLLELRPTALIEAFLSDLIKQQVTAAHGRSGIDLTLTIDPALENVRMEPDRQIALYRIVQEALNNVIKHSGAKHASVILRSCMPGPTREFELVVADDGGGFEYAEMAHDHLGLRIIRERADEIGALLQVESSQDRGTTILIRTGKK